MSEAEKENEVKAEMMTYDEYLKKYSSRAKENAQNSDDPETVAELFARETAAAFEQALAGLPR